MAFCLIILMFSCKKNESIPLADELEIGYWYYIPSSADSDFDKFHEDDIIKFNGDSATVYSICKDQFCSHFFPCSIILNVRPYVEIEGWIYIGTDKFNVMSVTTKEGNRYLSIVSNWKFYEFVQKIELEDPECH